jgi:hypothetical protein
MTARATTIQEAALRGARLQALTQKAAEQKAARLSQENAARMKRIDPSRAKYLTRLGFGGKKTRKNNKFVKQSALKSNKNKKKYNKSSRRKY